MVGPCSLKCMLRRNLWDRWSVNKYVDCGKLRPTFKHVGGRGEIEGVPTYSGISQQ